GSIVRGSSPAPPPRSCRSARSAHQLPCFSVRRKRAYKGAGATITVSVMWRSSGSVVSQGTGVGHALDQIDEARGVRYFDFTPVLIVSAA
ncbi:MAG: hypothetical protein ACREXY_04145, partial [Gammaproteobacteria bacterium]